MDWNGKNPVSPHEEKVPKRQRSLSNLQEGVLPPPPDCPPYLQHEYLPPWVGRRPADDTFTPERVDEVKEGVVTPLTSSFI